MAIELVTGYAGSAHISAADDGAFNMGAFGAGKYVFETASQLAASVVNANTVSVAAGDALFEGRHVRLASAETVSIDNGAQGVKRHDILDRHVFIRGIVGKKFLHYGRDVLRLTRLSSADDVGSLLIVADGKKVEHRVLRSLFEQEVEALDDLLA